MTHCRISVFDLDHTLVTCNSSFWFCTFLHKKKIFSHRSMLKAYLYRLRHDFSSTELEDLHSELFECLLKGLPMDFLENCIGPFMNSIWANVYYPAFQELRRAQHCGSYTIIMSSSPSFIVRRVAEAFGVDEWLATEYCLDSCQKLESVKTFIDGKAKASALKKLAEKKTVPLAKITAFSDSWRDLPMLDLAGKPVAVNPDPKLHALSIEKQWLVL